MIYGNNTKKNLFMRGPLFGWPLLLQEIAASSLVALGERWHFGLTRSRVPPLKAFLQAVLDSAKLLIPAYPPVSAVWALLVAILMIGRTFSVCLID